MKKKTRIEDLKFTIAGVALGAIAGASLGKSKKAKIVLGIGMALAVGTIGAMSDGFLFYKSLANSSKQNVTYEPA